MTHLARIASRVIGCPLLVRPQTAETVFEVCLRRANSGPFEGTRRREDGRYSMTRKIGSVAEIRVEGELVNKGAWIDAESGLTSYEGLTAQLRDAEDDVEITAIVLDIDSPGGEAGGMYGIAETIRGLSKPVIAVVNDMACSAAYGIASAADEIVVSPTSTVGSIGVVLVHFDNSKALEDEGVKPTIIHAGAHKADGHPFGPLPDAVRDDLQAHVLTIYDRFLETVELGRGARLTADAARATEARVFLGQDAIDRGLADRLGSLETVLSDLNAAPAAKSRRAKMADKDQDAVSRAEHDRQVAAAREEGMKAGIAQENERVKAILSCDAAKGREAHAAKMAMRTEVGAELAAEMLGDMPKADAGASVPPIGERSPGAEFGSDTPDAENQPEKPSMGSFLGRNRAMKRA